MVASSSKHISDTSAHQKSHSAPKVQQSKKTKGKGKGKEIDISHAVPSEGAFEEGHLGDTGTQNTANSQWEWHPLTDPGTSTVAPIFTKDGSYFFSVVGSSVKIHSTSSGHVVSTLYAPQTPSRSTTSSNTITSAVLNPSNAFQLITGSLNGYIIVWDFLDGVILQTIDVAQPIHHLCAHAKFSNSVFIAVGRSSSKKKSGDDNAVVLQVSLTPSADSASSDVQKSAEITAVGKTRLTCGLSFSPSGAWLVAISSHKAYVVSTSSFRSGFTKFVSPDRLTCLAIPPAEEYFATGDEKGHIRLWYCLNDDAITKAVGVEKKAQTTTLHWHAHAVSSIAFTANGAYLLSGGEEAVLVIWQLHTGKKEFVPRVGSPISTIALSSSQSQEEYLLGLVDSTYMFINAGTLKISRSYSRIKLDPNVAPQNTMQAYAPIAYHSLTQTLILPSSHPSSLQVYDPSASKIISELEVVPSNRISRRDERPIEPPRVEKVVISTSGEWMATIDRREGDDAFRGEVHLKIWWWDRKSAIWVLNTRIDGPHGLHPVTTITFQPIFSSNQALQLVTAGEDGNVKTWRLRSLKHKKGPAEDFWILRSSLTFRSQVPKFASFSPCGSILALSLGSCVALYDSNTNILRQNLFFTECKGIKSAHFVGKGRYLAIVGTRDVIVWDLISQRVQWHQRSKLDITFVQPHPSTDTFVTFCSSLTTSAAPQSRVSVYRAMSRVPLKSRILPFTLRSTAWYPGSTSSPTDSFSLVGINQSWGVVLYGDGVKPKTAMEGMAATNISSRSVEKAPSLFQGIFGKSSIAESSASNASSRPHIQPWSGKEAHAIFDGPAYLLPPMGSLFDSLLESFLKVRPESSDPSGKDEQADEDVGMEEGADDRVVTTADSLPSIDTEEMDALVSLFKVHSVTCNSKSKLNGVSRPNGVSHSPRKMNGISGQLKAASAPASLLPPPCSPTSSDTSDLPSPVTTGNLKKRKKAP